jgi:hypothetical protein
MAVSPTRNAVFLQILTPFDSPHTLPLSVRFQHRIQYLPHTSAASSYRTKHFSSISQRRAEAKYLEWIYCRCGLTSVLAFCRRTPAECFSKGSDFRAALSA